MIIYAFIGKSGSGKSFQAPDLMRRYNIKALIDDGLLILNNSILAGKSAKRQSTTVGAIKTALFTEEEHRDQVRQKLLELNIESLLIIGTSDRMVEKIALRLGLGSIDQRIYIEDITSEEERETARKFRNDFGQHIIPAPSVQIKRDFSGYFLHPLRSLQDLGIGKPFYGAERSVVRPTYSYLGDYTVSDIAIDDIIKITAVKDPNLKSVNNIYLQNRPDGVFLNIGISVKYPANIIKTAEKLQSRVSEKVEKMTALNVKGVNVNIENISD